MFKETATTVACTTPGGALSRQWTEHCYVNEQWQASCHVQAWNYQVKATQVIRVYRDVRVPQKPFHISIRHLSSSLRHHLTPRRLQGIVSGVEACACVVSQASMAVHIWSIEANRNAQATPHGAHKLGVLEL